MNSPEQVRLCIIPHMQTKRPQDTNPAQAPFRLLVVDDEPGVREILSVMLTEQGYEILTAEDGFQALEVLEQFRPHLVVTDLSMPRMSGLDLLRTLRQHLPAIPVIVVSGESGGDTRGGYGRRFCHKGEHGGGAVECNRS